MPAVPLIANRQAGSFEESAPHLEGLADDGRVDLYFPDVVHRRTRSLEVSFAPPMRLSLDGEPLESADVDIAITDEIASVLVA